MNGIFFEETWKLSKIVHKKYIGLLYIDILFAGFNSLRKLSTYYLYLILYFTYRLNKDFRNGKVDCMVDFSEPVLGFRGQEVIDLVGNLGKSEN